MDLMTILFGLHVIANSFDEYEKDCDYEDGYDEDFDEFEDEDDY